VSGLQLTPIDDRGNLLLELRFGVFSSGVCMAKVPLLFLSHSGVDTEGARELKRRIEASPSARQVGSASITDVLRGLGIG
jgi:hypothetical protein